MTTNSVILTHSTSQLIKSWVKSRPTSYQSSMQSHPRWLSPAEWAKLKRSQPVSDPLVIELNKGISSRMLSKPGLPRCAALPTVLWAAQLNPDLLKGGNFKGNSKKKTSPKNSKWKWNLCPAVLQAKNKSAYLFWKWKKGKCRNTPAIPAGLKPIYTTSCRLFSLNVINTAVVQPFGLAPVG